MKFTKTIAAAAITASSAFGLIGPTGSVKTYCLDLYQAADGVAYAGSCDQSANNDELGKKILANGCAEEQVALTGRELSSGKYDIEIASCLPPTVVQL